MNGFRIKKCLSASFGIYHPLFCLPVFPFLFLLHLCLNLRKPRKKLKNWKKIN